MNTTTHSEQFHIAADHPALPGHFPGAPIVPGVVLLDRVVAAVQRVWQVEVIGLAQVKFMRPLAPEQSVQLTIEREGAAASFRIVEHEHTIASGQIEIAG